MDECINANIHTIELNSTEERCIQFSIALPCDNAEVCRLLAMYNNFEITRANRYNQRFASLEAFEEWFVHMSNALANMRSFHALKSDIETLGPQYRDSPLQLVKFIKNKYQFGLKETKEMIDLYYLTL